MPPPTVGSRAHAGTIGASGGTGPLLFTPPDRVRVLGPEETLDGGEVLPGFSCKVAELFE
jgi:hypothetical protein